MTAFRAGDSPAASWLSFVMKHAGNRAWLFEEADLTADSDEQFTTDEGKRAWRRKKPAP